MSDSRASWAPRPLFSEAQIVAPVERQKRLVDKLVVRFAKRENGTTFAHHVIEVERFELADAAVVKVEQKVHALTYSANRKAGKR